MSDRKPSAGAIRLAGAVVKFAGEQAYNGEPLLNAIVCCDFVSNQRFVEKISSFIDAEVQPLVDALREIIDLPRHWKGNAEVAANEAVDVSRTALAAWESK